MVSLAVALLIVVEISPAPLEVTDANTLIGACSSALGASCQLGRPAPSDSPDPEPDPDGVALITLGSGGKEVHIVVERRGDAIGRWRRRSLEFAPEDASQDRWRAVGLTIATLFGDGSNPTAAAPRDAPPPAPPAESPRQRSPKARSTHHSLRLQAGIMGGPALNGGPWRRGGAARVTAPLGRSLVHPTLEVAVLASTPDRSQTRTESWLASLGAELAGEVPALRLRPTLRLEGFLERLVASHSPPYDRGSDWRVGLRAGAQCVWPHTGWWGLVAGVDLWMRDSSTAVFSGNMPLANTPALTATTTLGAEVRIP